MSDNSTSGSLARDIDRRIAEQRKRDDAMKTPQYHLLPALLEAIKRYNDAGDLLAKREAWSDVLAANRKDSK